MPSYLHDDVGATVKVLYAAHGAAAPGWMRSAIASPELSHPHIEPMAVDQMCKALDMLAQYGVSAANFASLLTRGIKVSVAEDQ
eukprot:3222067-Prymnesium_polylepis.1